MKKITLLLLLFLGTFQISTATAQVTRSFEVTVKDTVELKVTKFSYLLTLDTTVAYWEKYYREYDYSEYYDEYEEPIVYEEVEAEKKSKKRKKKEEEPVIIEEERVEEIAYSYEEPELEVSYLTKEQVIEILDKGGYKYEVDQTANEEEEDYSDYGAIRFNITLTSQEELTRIKKDFEYRSEISGEVQEVTYQSIEDMMQSVYESLYSKALKEAGILAKISGLTLGKLMKVSIDKKELGSFMDSYSAILENLSYKLDDKKSYEPKKEIIERTFVFEVK